MTSIEIPEAIIVHEAEAVPHFSKVCFNHPEVVILRKNRSPIQTRMTIAYQSFFVGDEKHVVFAFAVCSPKDTFKKATGRELALERLNDDETALSFQLRSDETAPIHSVIAEYISRLSGITQLPGANKYWSDILVG